MLAILAIAVCVYLVCGLCYWLRVAYGAIRLHSLPSLSAPSIAELQEWPQLSVVIAACNEADKLEHAARSLLANDYPHLQVAIVDDRSTDGTGQCVDRLAAEDARIVPVHIAALPEGWLGKVNALNRGLGASNGEFVLFTDADVHFAPGTLRKAVACCLHDGIDHLVACPSVWSAGLVVDSMIESFIRQFFTFVLPPWRVNERLPRAFIGVGAFNMVRRSAFEKTEGFEWLRLETADDAGLGLLMARSGARSHVVTAFDDVGLHWYGSVSQMMQGAEKGYASGGNCSIVRMVSLAVLGMLLEMSPLAGLLYCLLGGVPATRVLGCVTMAAFVAASVVFARWHKGRMLPAILTPLVAPVLAACGLRAGWLGWMRGGITWRGTFYRAKVLRAGRRI
jgi:hypothetical protein